MKFRNDQQPSYYTSIDDRVILFDSFDNTQSTTLESARTYGYGGLIPEFVMNDNFIPKLDARQFTLLLNAAKSQAFIELKQVENADAAKKSRRHRILMNKEQNNTDPRSEIKKHKGYGR